MPHLASAAPGMTLEAATILEVSLPKVHFHLLVRLTMWAQHCKGAPYLLQARTLLERFNRFAPQAGGPVEQCRGTRGWFPLQLWPAPCRSSRGLAGTLRMLFMKPVRSFPTEQVRSIHASGPIPAGAGENTVLQNEAKLAACSRGSTAWRPQEQRPAVWLGGIGGRSRRVGALRAEPGAGTSPRQAWRARGRVRAQGQARAWAGKRGGRHARGPAGAGPDGPWADKRGSLQARRRASAGAGCGGPPWG